MSEDSDDIKKDLPTFDDLLNPTLRALHRLGASATIQELAEEIVDDLDLSSEMADLPHGKGSQTEVEYRAGWARTYLKKAGLIENSERGVWALTPEGSDVVEVDSNEIVQTVREAYREKQALQESKDELPETELDESAQRDWRDELLETLLEIEPAAFERLCQRLLRESGFIEVEVTQRTGDGGIDGHGIIRVAGLISFTVLFQSKRYQGNIGPNVVRDFRGAMIGRADKGLLITTGGFTREARKEATRDGAPPVDLIDGELLVEKLKELKLGVRTKRVEEIEIDTEWFRSI